MINLEDEMDQLLAEDQVNLLEADLTRNDDQWFAIGNGELY